MIKQTLMAACVLMTALAPSAASAGRFPRGNQVEVTQVGNNNGAGVAQNGANNNAQVSQRGNGSTAVIVQNGNNHNRPIDIANKGSLLGARRP